MISHKLLNILCCPETKLGLKIGDDTLLEQVVKKQESGTLKNISGGNVIGPVTGILVREDDKLLYIIRDEIPVLLIEEGVLISEIIN